MYILIVARNYPKEKEPLLGIFEFDQAKALRNFGHKVVYLSLDLRSIFRKRRLGVYWSVFNEINILNISLPLGKISNVLRYLIGKIALSIYFEEIQKKHGKPDIIHAHFTGIGVMSVSLKRKFKIPLVLTEHSSHINKDVLSDRLKCLALEAYSNSNRLISVSTALSKVIFEHFSLKSDVVHNVVDIDEFYFIEKNKPDMFTFISVGLLNRNKGFDILVKAFYQAAFDINVQLKIIGKGPEFENLQCQIESLGLNKQIKLLGFLNRNQISKVMQKSNVFVLASRSETFGVAYIEAMLSGLPVIATSCGGPEDFVTTENGLIVPVDHVDALKDAMIRIRDEINNYNGKIISENCKLHFSPISIATQLTKIYESVLNDNP